MYENWMDGIENKKTLSEFTMPGSHDAGMYKCKEGYWRVTVRSVVTQFVSILEQLKTGARFFDIRVYESDGVFRVGHFASKNKAILGAYGPLLKEVLDDIATFFANFQSEVVILKFSIASAAKNAIGAIEETLRAYLYKSAQPENLAAVPLEKLRGKVLAVFDFAVEGFPNTLHLVSKETPKTPEAAQQLLTKKNRSILWLNGKAPEKLEIDKVISKQNEKRAKQKDVLTVPHLEMYYLTVTGTLGSLSVSGNTARQFRLNRVVRVSGDPNMSEYMAWDSATPVETAYALRIMQAPTNVRMNIFMYDFVNTKVNGQILMYGQGTLAVSEANRAAFEAANLVPPNDQEENAPPVQGAPEPPPPPNLDEIKDKDIFVDEPEEDLPVEGSSAPLPKA